MATTAVIDVILLVAVSTSCSAVLPVMSSGASGGALRTSPVVYENGGSAEMRLQRSTVVLEALEQLGVIDRRNRTLCFVLENIRVERGTTLRTGRDEIGATPVNLLLQLREFTVADSSQSGVTTDADEEDGQSVCLALLMSAETTTSIASVHGRVDGTEDIADIVDKNDITPKEIVLRAGDETPSTAGVTNFTDDKIGLNKRQILVISTCSTVIGVFFIVALALRVRNYIKRSKQDKDSLNKRHVRSASLSHRARHGSVENFGVGDNRRWSQFNPFNTDR